MNAQVEALSRLLRLLETTQWQSPAELDVLQRRQLLNVATHCQAQSPQFRARLQNAELTAKDLAEPEGLQRLPILHRRDVQTANSFYCEDVPDGHKPTFETRTSGSTGEPVVVRRTQVGQLDWMATTMREHLWHKRQFMKPVCTIRANIGKPLRRNDWGPPVSLLFKSAPLLGLPITMDVGQQLEQIAAFQPHTLMIYPNNLAGLMRICETSGIRLPSVKQILTLGETLSDDLRQTAREMFRADVADMYSSQELGTIALQCPESGLYHAMAENLIVEVLDANGKAALEGETGRLTITDVRNYATPLIRYDIGDYAQVGPPCPCGRGLPTLKRVMGRERNLILMPDGTRHWPLVGFHKFRKLAPIAQYQFIQNTRKDIDVRLVTERPLTTAEEDSLRALIQKALGFAFDLHFVYFDDEIPKGPTGKFEEFVCRLPG